MCYESDDAISVMYCGEPEPDCAALGDCIDGGYCEPEGVEACQVMPGGPVCYESDDAISVMYCGQRDAP